MKFIRLLLLVLFLTCTISSEIVIGQSTGEDANPYRAESLDIDLTIDGNLVISAQKTDYQIDFLNAKLYFKPITTENIEIIKIVTEPDSEQLTEYFEYKWKNIKTGIYNYGLEANLKTTNTIAQVEEKIKFPAQITDQDDYLKSTEKIDSNHPEVIKKANELAQGEDDYYEVVSKIGIWVKNNIEYDLSTMTIDVAQKASWVLENKKGVCDELTSLFIAMLRSVGIPAKFVSGVAYTEDPQFPDKWGAHGWAEVYFPGTGWIPYDPTYGEFGWIDPTHIKLKEANDPTSASVRYEWQGSNVHVEANPIEISAEITNIGIRAEPLIAIELTPLYSELGFGSYNLIEADVTNLNDYYVTVELQIAQVNEMELLDQSHKQVVLKPGETRKVFWKSKVSKDLDANYIYTIPLQVESIRKEKATSEFVIQNKGIVYDSELIGNAQGTLEEEREKEQSKNIELICSVEKEKYYSYEENEITCKVRNIGNYEQNDLKICLNLDCKMIDSLLITQEDQVRFLLDLDRAGKQSVIITAKNAEISKTSKVAVELLDQPDVLIEEIKIPDSVSYSDYFQAKFVIKKESESPIKNMKINFDLYKISKQYDFQEFFQDQEFEISLNGKNLKPGQNILVITVDYTDENGKTFHKEKRFEIMLENVSFFQRILLFFTHLI